MVLTGPCLKEDTGEYAAKLAENAPDLKKWLDDAGTNVIYITLGSEVVW